MMKTFQLFAILFLLLVARVSSGQSVQAGASLQTPEPTAAQQAPGQPAPRWKPPTSEAQTCRTSTYPIPSWARAISVARS